MNSLIPACWCSHELHLHLPQHSFGNLTSKPTLCPFSHYFSPFCSAHKTFPFGFWPYEWEHSEPGVNAEVPWPLWVRVWPCRGHGRTHHYVKWFSKSRRNSAGLGTTYGPSVLTRFIPFCGHFTKTCHCLICVRATYCVWSIWGRTVISQENSLAIGMENLRQMAE